MKATITALSLVVLLGISVSANAILIDRGVGMIYDTELGITWLQDANYAHTSGYDDGKMYWQEAMEWADQLEYGGHTDWRLPKTLPVNGSNYTFGSSGSIYDGSSDVGYNIGAPNSVYPESTGSEMSHLFYSTLGNLGFYDIDGNDQQPGYGLTKTGPFINLNAEDYWSSTEFPLVSTSAFDFDYGRQSDVGKTGDPNVYSWAVRDGDYGPSVSTDQTYLSEYLTLGDTFSFDYFWEMGTEPTDQNFDVLFFNGTNWETFGWELNLGGSSTDWASASFWVPEWARGENVQIMFSLYDWGTETDPTVYLRNIASNGTAPVPEPATMLLFGTGLVGLVGARFRRKK